MKERGLILNGPVVRALRMAKGLSVRAAAAELGVSAPTWSLYESGGRGITPGRFAAMVDLFELDDDRPLRVDTIDEVVAEAERKRGRRNTPQAAA